MTNSRFFVINEHPEGVPSPSLFKLREQSLSELGEGEVRIKNSWLSVDPYMRGRMSGKRTYTEPYELNAPLTGAAIGEVVESSHEKFKPGDKVRHMGGWRDVAQLPGNEVEILPNFDVPEQAYLGVLGMPGMTAWTGLNVIAGLKSGERVLVSAASGAVGSLAVQLARLKDCQVIGSAGSQQKRDWLEHHDVTGIDHHQDLDELKASLHDAAPQGIDVYYENVGGDMFEAALDVMNPFGRIAVCGWISGYNAKDAAPGPANIAQILMKRLRIQGFIVGEHWEHYRRFLSEVGPQVEAGNIDYQETVEEGLENTPKAFLRLFEGSNHGKMLVKL
ncbi:NADP-dependent oxidoreductase [Phytohalomonas tamaricis]|uniref:NADP-dependent oxidoreductase n=1 Tax=Phytohalomonas tamaricis TaxID=2081032 RepID=UPI000D0BCBBB|nr:NADP-dependent oxidoreductase [Phytohalomonas tamaricis]